MKGKSKKNICFKLRNKRLKIPVIVMNNFVGLLRGLTFRFKKNARALLFEFKKPMAIHSFFVFFPFIAVWLDEENNVISIKKVRPFTFHIKPKKEFSKLVEIPINNRYKRIIDKINKIRELQS